jgi:hypothetical protein
MHGNPAARRSKRRRENVNAVAETVARLEQQPPAPPAAAAHHQPTAAAGASGPGAGWTNGQTSCSAGCTSCSDGGVCQLTAAGPSSPAAPAAAAAAAPPAPQKREGSGRQINFEPNKKPRKENSTYDEQALAEKHGGVKNIPYDGFAKAWKMKGHDREHTGEWEGHTYAEIEALPPGPRREALHAKWVKLRELYVAGKQAFQRQNVAGGASALSKKKMQQKRKREQGEQPTAGASRATTGTGKTSQKRRVTAVKDMVLGIPPEIVSEVSDLLVGQRGAGVGLPVRGVEAC